MSHTPFRQPTAFTLTEMLVVMGIALILIAIGVPSLGPMIDSSRMAAARQTVSTAMNVTRAYAVEPHPDLGAAGGIPGATYSGTAALFTPQGKVRLLENDQTARASRNLMLESNGANGYRDIEDVDQMDLPDQAGTLGMRYEGGDPELLKPPFAVTFNEHGQRVSRASGFAGNTQGLIYYDDADDDNGEYQIGETRDSPSPGFNLGQRWDPRELPVRDQRGRAEMPFEAIESVTAIVVVDRERAGGRYLEPNDNLEWLLNNSRVMFVSPNTGMTIGSNP